MKKRTILIAGIAGALVLVVMGGFIVTRGFAQPLVVQLSLQGQPTSVEGQPTETAIVPFADPSSVPPGSGVMIDLGSKVINLADPGGYRYLRVGLVLEFSPQDLSFYTAGEEDRKAEEEKLSAEVTRQRAVIDDAVITLLSDKTFGDIFSIAGKETLKEELRAAINDRVHKPKVLRIYFTDFLVQ